MTPPPQHSWKLDRLPGRRCARRLVAGALLAALLAVPIGRPAEGAVVVTVKGQRLEGEVAAWDSHSLTLQTPGGQQRLAASQLMELRFSRELAEAPAPFYVEFTDGARTSYVDFTVAGRTVKLTGPRFDDAGAISRDQLRLVELQAATPALVAVLAEMQKKELAGDAIVVSKREGQSMDYLVGVLQDVTPDQVSFEWDGEVVPVKRGKVAAIVYYQGAPPQLADPVCELSLADGSHIMARELSLRENRLAIETPAGIKLTIGLEEITSADFSAGKLAYLSDLTPAEVVWTPRIELPPAAQAIRAFGEPRNDQSFSGLPLSLAWKDDVSASRRDVRTYDRGLALRSRTELTYRIPEGMKRFVAIAGIDPATASQGNVLVQIRGDDRTLWEGQLAGGQPPEEINLELGAARRLHLTVDYGENLDYGDRLHLVEARFIK
ncbi:MAG: NPCBM/NEW2 domain-containing protein [Pirellulales bacterium]|nr:NPCBM/NEW2 domain-containing protein [Pirellulales bacterium]